MICIFVEDDVCIERLLLKFLTLFLLFILINIESKNVVQVRTIYKIPSD